MALVSTLPAPQAAGTSGTTTGSRKELSGRIPGLDGMRAIAISMVLWGHAAGTGPFAPPPLKSYLGDLGNFGVRLFFVISGYLITSLLLREKERHGSISLRQFFIRRSLRIFPASYTFLAIMLVAQYAGFIHEPLQVFLRAGTYTINYLNVEERGWNLGHLWSLSVEEQFYLLWPLCLAVLGVKRSLPVLLGILVFVPLIRYFTWRYVPAWTPGLKWNFHTVCDALAAGCLLAFACMKARRSLLLSRFLKTHLLWLGILAAIGMNALIVGRPRVNALLGQSVMNVGIACFLGYLVMRPNHWMVQLLSRPSLVHLGALSYSLYLWQQPFLNRGSTYWVCQFPQNLTAAILMAALSYRFVELPFLALKERWAR